MKTPVLSFVIPVYQKPPEVFRKALEYIYDQSLKDLEVIAVFDGPNEELQLVTADFPQVISLVIEHGGASKARNAGLEIATGEFVVFWDADCYIKPHAAKRWIEEFEAVPDADFVYTGYEISQERGGFDSEPFDAYSLTSGNYISSMSPIRRAKAHKWDESLPAGQDWDYWLTAVERGLKGVFIEGSGFITDTPHSGISSVHWSGEKRMETINRVREKHGITGREIGVYSMNYRVRAIKLAKILGGDVIKPSGIDPDKYKVLFNLGYGFLSRFEGIPDTTVKIQYWLPGEIAGLAEAKYNVVMETIRIAKGVINYCGTDYEKNKLADLGITAEVLPLPIDEDEAAKIRTDLPKEFSVLVATDDAYAELLKDIEVDLPHIKFGFRTGKIDDYSCFLSFYQFAALDDAMLIALVNGRHVISNVLSPYCGFVDPEQTWDNFKRDLYEKIREVSTLPFNADAQAFYKDLADPKTFREKIKSLVKPELEVVA